MKTVRSRFCKIGVLLCAAFLSQCSTAPPLSPEGAQADAVLKSMGDKLAHANALSFSGHRSLTQPLVGGSGARESSEIAATFVRPNKFKGSSTDAHGQRRFYYDGDSFVVYDAKANVFSRLKAPPTFDDLAKALAEDYNFAPPGFSLCVSDPYASLSEDHPVGRIVGTEVKGGVPCQHLIFRDNLGVWELWVDAEYLPRGFKHTFGLSGEGPTLAIELTHWNLSPDHTGTNFTFAPPGGATETAMIPAAQVTLEETNSQN